ncbi:unnamed protein product [marine sediment metagenome]|uniref:Uncharacterized protein n=1 Tax=marine sediment metagenome TaxID=412755 RepID=X0SGI6_9ZZZZ
MGSKCSECGAVNEQLHKKACFWYPREAKARDKEIEQLQAELERLKLILKVIANTKSSEGIQDLPELAKEAPED